LWRRLLWAVWLLSLGALPAGAAQGPTDGLTLYLPVVSVINDPTPDHFYHFPLLQLTRDMPVSLIANPSFENESWFTDLGGNQRPTGWSFYSPPNGQVMPFPTKRQGGGHVPAISGGTGEYVHKYYWQLPENERVGGTRGLILNGQLTYKVFSDHIPHALRLTQTLHYTPGRSVKVTGYILGETNIFTCNSGGLLEDDHFIGSVQLGGVADTRFFNVMTNQHAVPGNERPWNKFSVTTQVPPNGQLQLVVVMQSNWGCPVDFFIDHFEAFDVSGP
jgi:hypothetical protein